MSVHSDVDIIGYIRQRMAIDENPLSSTANGSSSAADGKSRSRLTPLIIVGDGGHGRVVADNVRERNTFRIIAMADDRFTNIACRDGVFHIHPGMVRELVEADHRTKVLIAIGDNGIRSSMVQRLGLPPERYASIVHPAACVSKHAYIGPGSVVMAGAIVNHGACIGAHVIINSGAVVEHDAEIGWFAHVSPNSTLAGNAAVGEGAHIGIGASVIPSVRIGAWCIVGAGAAVIRDLPAGATAVGVPAKVIKQRDIIP